MNEIRIALPLLSIVASAACASPIASPDDGAPEAPAAEADALHAARGHVYALSNERAGNAVVIFDRAADGTLTAAGRVATGGLGSDDSLGSQGALTLSRDGRWLFAVNAGSNDVSLFRVRGGDLELADVAPTGGDRPVSVTEAYGLVYVLDAGGEQAIEGFYLAGEHLEPLAGSRRPLSARTPVGAAQIELDPDGDTVVVTEKATNRIDTFALRRDGTPGDPVVTPSAGDTPFGFAFDRRGTLVVSDAFGGAAGAGAVTSYRLRADGAAQVVSGPVADHQGAPCWVVVTRDGRTAYTSNAASGTVSAYRIDARGRITLLDGGGVAGATGDASHPTDMALAARDRFLYVRDGDGTIAAFRVDDDRTLAPIAKIAGLPAHAVGLAAR